MTCTNTTTTVFTFQVVYSFQPEITSGILVELLQFIQTETDVKDLIFLGEILESLVFDPNPYLVNREINTSDNTTAFVGMSSEVIDKLKKCGKLHKVRETEFRCMVQEMVNCLQNITHSLTEQANLLKLRLFLPLLGLLNCLKSGKVVTKCMSETHHACLVRHVSFFKLMKCNSQSDFEEAYFYLQSLHLDDPWSKEKFQHVVDKDEVANLIRCCENVKKTFQPGVADVLLKQWKEQLSDVAFLSASDGVSFRKEIENKRVELPDVNQTLMLLRKVDSVLPQYHCAEVTAFSNAIKEITVNIEAHIENIYRNSLQELKMKTALAIVDLKWSSYQGMLKVLSLHLTARN